MTTSYRVMPLHPNDCPHATVRVLYGIVMWCIKCGSVQDADLRSGWYFPDGEDLPMAYAGAMFDVGCGKS